MVIYIIILFAIVTRFIPHLQNAAAISAVAIFAGAMLPKKQAFAVPLLARFVSDAFIGFFQLPVMIAVYAAHAIGVLLGMWIKTSDGSRKSTYWVKIVGSGLISSILFFLITNCALLTDRYPHTWAGIMQAYTNGLPFYRGTLVGDVGYAVVLFGAYEVATYLAHRSQPTKKIIHA